MNKDNKNSPKDNLFACFEGIFSRTLKNLVAQSSATSVTVAGTALVARSVFGTQKCRDTLHQPIATPLLGPLPAGNERKVGRGVRRKVRHLDLGGGSAILARHL